MTGARGYSWSPFPPGNKAALRHGATSPQVVQPITGYTREVMAQAGISHTIPGLRHCVAALHHVGWWSRATAAGPGPGA